MLRLLVLVAGVALLGAACSGAKPPTFGLLDGRLRDCPDSPNCVSSQTSKKSHAVRPYDTGGDPQAAWQRLRAALADYPRCKIVEENGRYMRAEFRSAVFRFVDVGEFFPDEKAGVIHVRSASMTGYSDLGVNRKRVEKIRALLEKP
ncbi:MAG: DUF1499 domain-containing protein [Deltaproteobacteria bacterium]|nr:DUF1499 domain-containing protein [Deltaproteobacteria bacterium]